MLKLLLTPGIKIVSQLSIAKKFALIFILYLIPVCYVVQYVLIKHSLEIQNTQLETEKLTIIGSFKPIFVNMAKSRELTNTLLNGNQEVKTDIEDVVKIIDQQLKHISLLETYKNLTNNEQSELKSIQTNWKQLESSMFSMSPTESFTVHSQIINRINLLMNNILESSTLFTDSERQSSFLIQMVVKNLPAIIDTIGKSNGIGTGVATAEKFDSDTFIALSNHNKQLEQQRRRLANNFKTTSAYSESIKSLARTYASLDQKIIEFINVTSNKLLIPDNIEIKAETYFSFGVDLTALTLKLYDSSLVELKTLLRNRENSIKSNIIINISSSIFLILTALYLFASVYANMLNSISKIEKCVNTVADGDLTRNITINSKDEMKNIGDNLNAMIENTKTLVLQVSTTTKELVITAEENMQSATSTNEKIDRQNIEVGQVVMAMNQMSATVREVANNAEQTAISTANADNDSNRGLQVVQSTITSINELASEISNASTSIDKLQKDVKDISSVLDVIQGIADQTNLLALNAAIEAARAGESGRGFAVVADEVRALASKTQESTEEIRNMIDILQKSAGHSVVSMEIGNAKIKQTVEHANKAGEALQQISESVAKISQMGEQIASAAIEQSSVSGEINKSIISVKDISALTKQSAKDSSDNSQFVDKASKNLQELVSHFRVS